MDILLLELSVLERIARGKLVLSHRLYPAVGKAGAHARTRDQAREQNKTLLLDHLESNRPAGSAMEDLVAAFPRLSRSTIKRLLQELRTSGQIHAKGTKRNTRWFTGPGT